MNIHRAFPAVFRCAGPALAAVALLGLATARAAATQPGASLSLFTVDLFPGPTGIQTTALPAPVTSGTLYLSGSPDVIVFSSLTVGGQALGQATLFQEGLPGVPIVDPLPNNLSIPAAQSLDVTTYQPLNDTGGTAATYRIHSHLAAVPEPSPLALLALGLLPVGRSAWKRRRSVSRRLRTEA